MAKLDPNTLIGILRGRLGNLVFAQAKNGTVIVKRLPVRTAAFTGPERNNQSRFARAAAYVKSVHAQPELYALYRAAAQIAGKRACDLAHRDVWHPPVIQDVDLSSYDGLQRNWIRIRAEDDFQVLTTIVTLSTLGGLVLEHGEAQAQPNSPDWIYTVDVKIPAGQAIVVDVTAADRPGNIATKTLHHVLTSR